MSRIIRWGILGTGGIAKKFALGLRSVPDARLTAVGSRSLEAASAFAEVLGAERAFGSYQALAEHPDLDVVYVATPHPFHQENTEGCLRAGKAVLCEKPFALNARQAASMIAAARESGCFLMEAMWTRFLPLVQRMKALIAEGAIGDLRMVQSDFGYRAEMDPRSRSFDPDLGGGGLLDVGIYPVSLASLLLGRPDRIASLADLGSTGVDEQAGIVLGYPGGRMALLASAVRTETPLETTILGSAGWIRLHAPCWWPTRMTLSRPGGTEVIDLPFDGNGYNYEAAEVGRCLREGLPESPLMPLDETLSIMRTLDEIRSQWGLVYPME